MPLFTLVLVLHVASGTAGISIPNYTNINNCLIAGKSAEHNQNVAGWFCVPTEKD